MIAARNDADGCITGHINQSVRVVNTPAEKALQIVLQRLRFSDAVHIAISRDIIDQFVNALQCFSVLTLPIQIILPRFFSPDDLHSSSASISACSAV